jgi:hypothetical protein
MPGTHDGPSNWERQHTSPARERVPTQQAPPIRLSPDRPIVEVNRPGWRLEPNLKKKFLLGLEKWINPPPPHHHPSLFLPIWRGWAGQAAVILFPSRVAAAAKHTKPKILLVSAPQFRVVFDVPSDFRLLKLNFLSCRFVNCLKLGERKKKKNDRDYHRHDAPLLHHWLPVSR